MQQPLLLTAGFALLLVGPLLRTGTAADTISPLTMTCPADMTVVNDTYQCGTVVTFAPAIPGSPSRIHAQINLHDVVATLGGVTYHATNNVNAQLTATQLSPIALTVPGQYKFEAQGKAALHAVTLDMPLDVVITAGALSSAAFAPPRLVSR